MFSPQAPKPLVNRRFSRALFSFLAVSALSGLLFADEPAGVSRFHQVSDHLFRGAQPTADGFRSLAKLGVKTILDLRDDGSHSQDEKKMVEAAGMRYVSVPMAGRGAPTADQIGKALALLSDNSAGPTFVHCRHGVDRTGTVVACYRIAHDHWDNPKALAEARSMGMGWTERAMHEYVLRYKPAATVASAAAATAAVPALLAPVAGAVAQ